MRNTFLWVEFLQFPTKSWIRRQISAQRKQTLHIDLYSKSLMLGTRHLSPVTAKAARSPAQGPFALKTERVDELSPHERVKNRVIIR